MARLCWASRSLSLESMEDLEGSEAALLLAPAGAALLGLEELELPPRALRPRCFWRPQARLCWASRSLSSHARQPRRPWEEASALPGARRRGFAGPRRGRAAPGIYGNNCICRDTASGDRKFYEGDAKALREFGFNGFKPDGCGAQADMQLWDDVFMPDVGPPVMVENCYWGSKVLYEPTETWCPWNFST